MLNTSSGLPWFDWPFEMEAIISCQEGVKKLSNTNQNLSSVATVRCISSVKQLTYFYNLQHIHQMNTE